MNSVALIGRLTKDPEVRYNGGDEKSAMATFNLAIDRPPKKDGTKSADFPRVTVFGRQAINCERYLSKGRLVGIQGRIQTGSYQNRSGDTVFTTDVVADRVEFLEYNNSSQNANTAVTGTYQNASYSDYNQMQGGAMQNMQYARTEQPQTSYSQQQSAFEAIHDDDIPF